MNVQRERIKRKEEEEDVYHHYENMIAIQKRATPLIEMNNTSGFINQSRQTVAHTQFSDITLRIQFENTGPFPMITDIETHRFILATKSAYFESLFSQQFASTQQDPSSSIVILRLDQMPFSEAPVVREFFRLFYVQIFDDSQFTTNENTYIVTNVIVLHHLAEQFMFHALRKYCRHKIFQHLNLDTFTVLMNQCVARYNEGMPHQQPLYVIPGKESLFRRLVSWFVCCARVSGNNGLPFADLEGGEMPIINEVTQRPNSLIPPPQQHDPYKQKRKRISESSNRKAEILRCMQNTITDFDALYDTYSFSLQYDQASRATRIRSFGRLCESCAHNKSSFHFAVINQVMPEDDAPHRKWHIYLDLGDPMVPQSSALYVKLSNHEYPMLCYTRITTLSKRYKNKVQTGMMPMIIPRSSSPSFVNLQQFSLNEPEFCYHGQCDKCHLSDTRLFIIKYEIDAFPTV